MSAALLFNGRPEPPPLALHRGLHYGDGVFRTCLVNDGTVLDFEDHVRKVASDAARLGLRVDVEALQREAATLVAHAPRAVLKMLVLRAGPERGYRAGGAESDRLLCRYAAPRLPRAAWDQGVRVARARVRLALQPALAGIKHLNRLEQVLASRDWPQGADELLLEDLDGRPVSGTRTNLFWVAGGAVRTPALERCGVAGVMRGRVQREAQALGLDSASVDAAWSDVENADEVFLTNSIIGIWPVASFDARRWEAPGPVTRRLMDGVRHPRVCD